MVGLIPLRDASHADVVQYVVEIPMRYAECVALLEDGRKVGLKDRRRFVGWYDMGPKRFLLFRKNLLHIELRTVDSPQSTTLGPGRIYDIILESAVRTIYSGESRRSSLPGSERKFIGIDGSYITMPGRRRARLSAV